jgi:hypothetical protein
MAPKFFVNKFYAWEAPRGRMAVRPRSMARIGRHRATFDDWPLVGPRPVVWAIAFCLADGGIMEYNLIGRIIWGAGSSS